MKHHQNHKKILSSFPAEKTKTNICARDKKVNELDWAKNRGIEQIVLNIEQTGVDALAGRCWAKIPKNAKTVLFTIFSCHDLFANTTIEADNTDCQEKCESY
jgi:hypothetical protein